MAQQLVATTDCQEGLVVINELLDCRPFLGEVFSNHDLLVVLAATKQGEVEVIRIKVIVNADDLDVNVGVHLLGVVT